MILELHRQGVSVSAIARQVGLDRKTVHKYIERGLEPPMYGPRPPRASKIAPGPTLLPDDRPILLQGHSAATLTFWLDSDF